MGTQLRTRYLDAGASRGCELSMWYHRVVDGGRDRLDGGGVTYGFGCAIYALRHHANK